MSSYSELKVKEYGAAFGPKCCSVKKKTLFSVIISRLKDTLMILKETYIMNSQS